MAMLPLENKPLAIKWAHDTSARRKEKVTSCLTLFSIIAITLYDYGGVAFMLYTQIIMASCLMVMKGHYSTYIAASLIGLSLGMMASLTERYLFSKPLPDKPIATEITATISSYERQSSGRLRLWLINIEDKSHHLTLNSTDKIRIIYDSPTPPPIHIGDRFNGHIQLFPLSPPLFPDWPDYARKSWREGIVATGYATRASITSQNQPQSFIFNLRSKIATAIEHDLNPASATLAKALLIGQRDYSDKDIYDSFRLSGLAHLLAISGLHMGLFCFGVYATFRVFMALHPKSAQYFPPHKLAAYIALAAGFFYLMLAGHPISAIRAYLMASLILIAALIDRRTVTLRNLNLVALIFVICIPSAIYQPAFQLSFAATYGIVMFHDAMSSRQIFTSHKWVRAIAYIIITSLIAVLSTFLFSAYHFGITTLWGVAANIIAIPFTAMIVMPAGVVYLLSLIIGLNAILAPIFDFVLSALISFAGIISNLPYAGIIIKMPPSYFLILFAIWIGGFYYASAKIRTALISLSFCLAITWIVTPRPIAAIDISHGTIRFAYFDNGTLIHNRRMSDYWHNNYQKLFGEIKEVRAVACRKTCYFTTSDDIFVHIKSSTKRLTLCSANNRAQTVKTVKDCRSTQTHQLPDSKGFTTIYKHRRPYHNRATPELTIKPPTKSHHKWHPDKAAN